MYQPNHDHVIIVRCGEAPFPPARKSSQDCQYRQDCHGDRSAQDMGASVIVDVLRLIQDLLLRHPSHGG